MNYWLETNSTYHEREGLYLICPIHSEYVKNHKLYKIMLEPLPNDIVFHYFVYQSTKHENIIKSYSTIKNSYREVHEQDDLCINKPPYRKIELINNSQFKNNITYKMLLERRGEIEFICKTFQKGRTPFDKNFRFKQMYLSRVPEKLAEIFFSISEKN